jgi:hypothetical protein
MSDAPFDLIDAKDAFADSDWFHTCRETQTPYVVVRSGETSADVLWDFVTLPASCDVRLHGNFPSLERDARAIFDRFAIPESYSRIKPTMICFDRLPFEQAKLAAAELYGLISNYLAPAPNAYQNRAELDDHQQSRACTEHDGSVSPSRRRLWID